MYENQALWMLINVCRKYGLNKNCHYDIFIIFWQNTCHHHHHHHYYKTYMLRLLKKDFIKGKMKIKKKQMTRISIFKVNTHARFLWLVYCQQRKQYRFTCKTKNKDNKIQFLGNLQLILALVSFPKIPIGWSLNKFSRSTSMKCTTSSRCEFLVPYA